jgi:hypothetical protein
MNFDIDRYIDNVARVDDSDIDYDVFLDHPVTPEVLRCLRNMHDIEYHTTCYLRDLLVTSIHEDPEITSFLAMWVYEEFWHGQVVGKVLDRHGELHGRPRIELTRRRIGRERLGTIGMMALSSMTRDLVPVVLAWGAVNEWTTQAGYLLCAERCQHPVLSELLRRIARQEGLHIDFYASQAERRMQHPRTQRRVRAALARFWKPVGFGVMEPADAQFMVRYLFGGDDGRAMVARLDRRIERLPGLDGLGLIESARSRLVAA